MNQYENIVIVSDVRENGNVSNLAGIAPALLYQMAHRLVHPMGQLQVARSAYNLSMRIPAIWGMVDRRDP